MHFIDCFRNDESHSKPTTSNKRGALETAEVDRFSRGSTIPLSIKFKKLGNEDTNTSRQREHHGKDRLQVELGKSRREPPPVGIAPKRLKVKGPILGLQSRLY